MTDSSTPAVETASPDPLERIAAALEAIARRLAEAPEHVGHCIDCCPNRMPY